MKLFSLLFLFSLLGKSEEVGLIRHVMCIKAINNVKVVGTETMIELSSKSKSEVDKKTKEELNQCVKEAKELVSQHNENVHFTFHAYDILKTNYYVYGSFPTNHREINDYLESVVKNQPREDRLFEVKAVVKKNGKVKNYQTREIWGL